MNSCGENIKKIRTERKLTQEDLAKQIGISRNYLSELENDKRNISSVTLKKLSEKLEVSMTYLIDGVEKENNMSDTNYIIYEFGELDTSELTDNQLERVASAANNIQIDAEMEMRKRRVKTQESRNRDIHERVKQTDAMNIQEYHKSSERIAAMIKDADERED